MTNAISERVTFPRECPRSAPRILMLVPHEPYLDPRVQWATDLCADLCRTDVIGWSTHLSTQASREYDGTVYTELVNLVHFTTSEAYKRQEQDLFPFAGHATGSRARSAPSCRSPSCATFPSNCTATPASAPT